MILLDYSQVSISQITGNPDNIRESAGNRDLLKHIIINAIRDINVQFRKQYGELVICCDHKKNWRKLYFKHYKGTRKKNKEKSALNWDLIEEVLIETKNELKENFPFALIEARGAEADDVIAVLTKHFTETKFTNDMFESAEPIVIVSADEDFLQLQKFKNVKQWSKRKKEWLVCKDPELFLKEKVLRGDTGDGIPSFINPDTCLIEGVKQKPLYQTRIDTITPLSSILDGCNTIQEKERLKQNIKLIDFEEIPPMVFEEILKVWDEQSKKRKPSSMDLLNYFAKHHMNVLAGCIEDFKINKLTN